MTPLRRPQRGIILLGLMLILLLGIGLLLLQGRQGGTLALDRQARTVTALTAARDALLARAILDANHPGSLPCPDIATNITNGTSPNVPGDGIADMLAGNNCLAYVGWLPWRTLDLDDPRDSSGERFWYVLSANFRDADAAINLNTPGTLFLDGQGDIVALIIAPGGPLAGQNRPSNNVADYLDAVDGNPATSNRGNDGHYYSGPLSDQFNDRVVALDRQRLMAALTLRILGDIRAAVRAAGGALLFADSNGDGNANPDVESGYFPYREAIYDVCQSASPPANCKPWYTALENNGWFPLIAYDRAAATLTLGATTMNLP